MAITLATFIFTGCLRNDPCDSIDCSLNGTPTKSENGKICTCNCFSAFEGFNCAELEADKFIGKWQASDQCTSEEITYEVIISLDKNDQTRVHMSSFRSLGNDESWEAIISDNTINIPQGFIFGYSSPLDNSYVAGYTNGTGIMSADRKTINWEYLFTIVDVNNVDDDENSCTGVWTKIE